MPRSPTITDRDWEYSHNRVNGKVFVCRDEDGTYIKFNPKVMKWGIVTKGAVLDYYDSFQEAATKATEISSVSFDYWCIASSGGAPGTKTPFMLRPIHYY